MRSQHHSKVASRKPIGDRAIINGVGVITDPDQALATMALPGWSDDIDRTVDYMRGHMALRDFDWRRLGLRGKPSWERVGDAMRAQLSNPQFFQQAMAALRGRAPAAVIPAIPAMQHQSRFRESN